MTTQPPTTKEALERCPFCGGEAILLEDDVSEYPADGKVYHVTCLVSCSIAPGVYGQETREDAIRKWNTRSAKTQKGTLCDKHAAEFTVFHVGGCIKCWQENECESRVSAPIVAPVVDDDLIRRADAVYVAQTHNRTHSSGYRCYEGEVIAEKIAALPKTTPSVNVVATAREILNAILEAGASIPCWNTEQGNEITGRVLTTINEIINPAAAPASTVAPQQSDAMHCSECGHHKSNLDAEGRCSFGYNYHRNPKDWCGHRCVYENTAISAPASPAASSLEKCMAEPKSDTEPICANCEREIVKSEHGPPINDISWSHTHNGVVWCNWSAPAALRDEAERPRGIFDSGFATTPPSTLAKAAARAIANALERDEIPHHIEESEPFILAIIERCLAGGSAES